MSRRLLFPCQADDKDALEVAVGMDNDLLPIFIRNRQKVAEVDLDKDQIKRLIQHLQGVLDGTVDKGPLKYYMVGP